MNLFISGHGCRLNEKFKPGQRAKFHFKSPENYDINLLPCSISIDHTDMNPNNYKYISNQTSPTGIYDYRITFPDKMWNYGLITTGIFASYPNGLDKNFLLTDDNHLIEDAYNVHKLSDIVNVFKGLGYENFYLTICRGPCDNLNNEVHDVVLGGKKKRRYRKKMKSRRTKNKSKSQKKTKKYY